MTKKVIIDTDPGIDDCIAICMALNSEEIELLALTTIFGNCQTPVSTRNARYICEYLQKDIPIYQGARRPLIVRL